MAKTWYAWVIETGDLSGTAINQKVKFNSNISLKAIRTWFVSYNNPVFTNLRMKIYSNYNDGPLKLLHTSTNAWSSGQITSATYGLREIYFEFAEPFKKGADEYYVV